MDINITLTVKPQASTKDVIANPTPSISPIAFEGALHNYSLKTLQGWSKDHGLKKAKSRQENIDQLTSLYRQHYPSIAKRALKFNACHA